MDERYVQAWKEVSEKADALASQLVELATRLDELQNDNFLKGQLIALPSGEERDELNDYCCNLKILSEGVEEAISFIVGNLAIARGED